MSGRIKSNGMAVAGLVVLFFLAAQAVYGRPAIPTGGESEIAGVVKNSDWAERHPNGLGKKIYAPDFGERHPNGFLVARTYAPDFGERHPNGFLAVKTYAPDWAERHPNGLLAAKS